MVSDQHPVNDWLAEHGQSPDRLAQVFGAIANRAYDFADLYLQDQVLESFSLEDGRVTDAGYSHDQGAGIRVNSGEQIGFAYTDDLSDAALRDAIRAAGGIAAVGQTGSANLKRTHAPRLYRDATPADIDRAARVELLQQLDRYTRELDPRVAEVSLSMVVLHERICVLDNLGNLAMDVRPLVRFGVSVIVAEGDRRERGQAGGGGRIALSQLTEGERCQAWAREAVRVACVNLEAVAAPAGSYPVVLGAGWPGILLHEAVGHGLEGDFNRKGTSNFSGRMGERVAAPGVTVIDDATLTDRRGSLSVDDEGVAGQRTVLIEDGILVGYLQDRLNARLMGTQSTGNGRRESYSALTMPRMTNTFMQAGQSDPGDIIASVDDGIYAVNFGGGQVDITSGNFVFSTTEAYRIRNGKIAEPIKGSTLIGDGPEVMGRISMIGNDLALDEGVGTCGKEGQSVPVGVGQPTLKIDQLVVGGGDA
ncbi:MAG: metalloprotease TldD [Litorivicinus sp.]